MNFRVPPRWPLPLHHHRFLLHGLPLPRRFHPTTILRNFMAVRSSSFSAGSSTAGGGGREGNFLLLPGATMATILMLGFLHARRMYDDKKVEDMKVKGMEQEFSPDAKAAFLRFVPLRSVSRLWGYLMSVDVPVLLRPFIYKAWSRAFHSDLDEVALPLENYASLQEFFAHSLKEGSRPVDLDPKSLVSPVDGKILRLGELKGSSAMIEQVKGFSYSASSLLGANSSLHEAANEDRNNQYPEQSLTEDSSRKSWWHISFASPKVRNPATCRFTEERKCQIMLAKEHRELRLTRDMSSPLSTNQEDFINSMDFDLVKLYVQCLMSQPVESSNDYRKMVKSKNTSTPKWSLTVPKKGIFYCVIYLKPGDYHRIHSPVDWQVLLRRHFAGRLYPTNERAARTIRNLYIENERVVLEGQWKEGFLAVAAIGATNVGSIKLLIEPELKTNRPLKKLLPSGTPDERVYEPEGVGLIVKKGEEVAAFNMGSTVVLVFQAPISESPEKIKGGPEFKFCVRNGDRIRVGEAIGRWGDS